MYLIPFPLNLILMLVQTLVDLESLECMAKGELDTAVIAEEEAEDVLGVTGANLPFSSHHQLKCVAMDGDKEEDQITREQSKKPCLPVDTSMSAVDQVMRCGN